MKVIRKGIFTLLLTSILVTSVPIISTASNKVSNASEYMEIIPTATVRTIRPAVAWENVCRDLGGTGHGRGVMQGVILSILTTRYGYAQVSGGGVTGRWINMNYLGF